MTGQKYKMDTMNPDLEQRIYEVAISYGCFLHNGDDLEWDDSGDMEEARSIMSEYGEEGAFLLLEALGYDDVEKRIEMIKQETDDA